MKNVLITGALGYILSNLTNFIAKKHDLNIVVLDKNSYVSSLKNIDDDVKAEIIIGDICNKELVSYILEKFSIDTIIHGAAESHVDNSFFNSLTFSINNIVGTHTLLECARLYQQKTNNLKVFLHISTDEIYNCHDVDVKHTEESTYSPTNPYACTKLGAEYLVKSYNLSYGLPYIICRMNNCWGGRNQYPEKLIPKFICALLNGEKLTIHGKGNARRSFIHVLDVCKGIELILLKGEINNVYNIGADHDSEFTVLEIAKLLVKLIKNDDDYDKYLTYVPDRLFQDMRYNISSEKIKKLGWKQEHTDFVEEMKKFIEWYKINKSRYGL